MLMQTQNKLLAKDVQKLRVANSFRVMAQDFSLLAIAPTPTLDPYKQVQLPPCCTSLCFTCCFICCTLCVEPLVIPRTSTQKASSAALYPHLQSCRGKSHPQSAPRWAAGRPGMGCYTRGPRDPLRYHHYLPPADGHSAGLESQAELPRVTKHTCSLRRTCSTCDCGGFQEAHTKGFLSYHVLQFQHALNQHSRCLEPAIGGSLGLVCLPCRGSTASQGTGGLFETSQAPGGEIRDGGEGGWAKQAFICDFCRSMKLCRNHMGCQMHCARHMSIMQWPCSHKRGAPDMHSQCNSVYSKASSGVYCPLFLDSDASAQFLRQLLLPTLMRQLQLIIPFRGSHSKSNGAELSHNELC